MIDGSGIEPGDALVGIASSGPHSNGYSLVRRVLERAAPGTIDGQPAAERLLLPTRIYVRPVLTLIREVAVRGLAHITGGGITDNLPRILPAGCHAEIDTSSWRPGPVFDWLADEGGIADAEMRRTFNCGVGMIAVVAETDVDAAIRSLSASGEEAWRLGRIEAGDGEVRYL
jgi:phosphoribosylformylglycinamidine cyclo-ligase